MGWHWTPKRDPIAPLCNLQRFARCLRKRGRENLLETDAQWPVGEEVDSELVTTQGTWGMWWEAERLEGKHIHGSRKQDDTSMWICPKRVGDQSGGDQGALIGRGEGFGVGLGAS